MGAEGWLALIFKGAEQVLDTGQMAFLQFAAGAEEIGEQSRFGGAVVADPVGSPMLAGVGTTRDMIFAEELNTRLVLPDVQRLDSGVVLLSYRPS